jgi:hypothetical protein
MKRKKIREKTKFICDRDSIYKLRCTYVYAMNMTIRDMGEATGDFVGEHFCGRCTDLQLIVYRLLVRLSL